jgi:hypothetical protein
MPLGQDRDRLISALGQALAQRDPEQALAWARGLVPPSQDAIRAVMQGMMQNDPERAVDLMISESEQFGPNESSSMMSSISMLLTLGSNSEVDFGRLLDRMAEVDNPGFNSMLSSAIGNWARNDSQAALSWVLANPEKVAASAFQNIAQQAAEADLNVAVSMLDQMPAEHRAGWVAGLSRRLAQVDPQQAVRMIDQLQGQPGYGAAFATVAREISRADPAAAARMLTTARPGVAANELANAATNIAAEWAGRDPAAAARWVSSLDGSPMQARALTAVAQRWALTDADQARQWLLGQRPGADRDGALRSYLAVVAQARGLEPDIVGAFSTDQAAQQALVSAISQIGRNDVEEARRLLNAHVTDPAMRASLENTLTRTGGTGGNNSILTSGGIVIF